MVSQKKKEEREYIGTMFEVFFKHFFIGFLIIVLIFLSALKVIDTIDNKVNAPERLYNKCLDTCQDRLWQDFPNNKGECVKSCNEFYLIVRS